MKRIMCARCKQGIEPEKINKITPNTFVCNSCYDELLQVDMRSTNRNMEERHKVLAALMFEEYFPEDEKEKKNLKIKDQEKFREGLIELVSASSCPGTYDLEETDDCSIECFNCWLNAIGIEED